MDKFLIAWLDRMPDWAITVSSLIFISIVLLIGWQIFTATKRYVDASSREEKLIELLEEKQALTEKINLITNRELQYAAALKKLSSSIDTYNNQIFLDDHDYVPFINQLLESAAFDIRGNSNSIPRCGFWINQQDSDELKLLFFSHGYGKIANEKTLKIERSIAGRCYRRSELINIPDVSQDSDWEKGYISKYKSLICIPLGDFGVLTIDSLEPLGEIAECIGTIYSHLLNGVFLTLLNQIEDAHSEEYLEINDQTGSNLTI